MRLVSPKGCHARFLSDLAGKAGQSPQNPERILSLREQPAQLDGQAGAVIVQPAALGPAGGNEGSGETQTSGADPRGSMSATGCGGPVPDRLLGSATYRVKEE